MLLSIRCCRGRLAVLVVVHNQKKYDSLDIITPGMCHRLMAHGAELRLVHCVPRDGVDCVEALTPGSTAEILQAIGHLRRLAVPAPAKSPDCPKTPAVRLRGILVAMKAAFKREHTGTVRPMSWAEARGLLAILSVGEHIFPDNSIWTS